MFHHLPFRKLPKVMVHHLVMDCTKKLNFIPSKGGISKYYSPHVIVTHRSVDHQKHLMHPFGTYVQAHNEPDPSNTLQPRTLDCIYLRYNANHQGGHELLDLRTGRVIQRRTVTAVPITKQVIDVVHAMATSEGMPDGLKIETKSGIILYDSSWIAGVDYDDGRIVEHEYDEDEFDEDYEDDGSDDDDDDDIGSTESETDDQTEDDSNSTGVARYDDEEVEEEIEAETVDDDDEEDEPAAEAAGPAVVTRSGRAVTAPQRLNLHQSHLPTQSVEPEEYDPAYARVIANFVCELNAMQLNSQHKHHSHLVTYSLQKGLKQFGERGYDAAYGEMKQLHQRKAFAPVDVSSLSEQERRRYLESIIFLVEKNDKRVKARMVANGSTQRVYMSKDDAASPTVMNESILLTGTIDAKEHRDVMTADIPNAFIQTNIETVNNERVIMKIKGSLVDMLVEMDPETYRDYVVFEGNTKVLYVQVLKAIYGMLQSSLLFYKKLRKDLEGIGFIVNPYDPCVANRIVEGKQHTVTWHVDDLKSSHVDPKVNDRFHNWLEQNYGDPEIGKVKAVRGKRHDYLAMVLDYSLPGVLKVDMTKYVKDMVEDFPEELQKHKCPWSENLFKVDPKSDKLTKEKAEQFHTFVAKGLFVCKRARQDIQPAIAFLTTRVKSPTKDDWCKLKRMMGFLKATSDDVLTLDADSSGTIVWHVDAAFAVHPDFRSHTGATMTLGKGVIQSVSTKQKINTRSSTEGELVSTDDVISKVMWTKLFLEAQGFTIKENIIHRDNQSTMKLEQNGKTSSGKRTRHFNIKYFYITCLIENNEVTIKYCPTDDMIADYMTKPLTGAKFTKFRKLIMNLP